MERNIARMTGHTIVCGWGRVGRAVGSYLAGQGADVVVVDRDPERVAGPRSQPSSATSPTTRCCARLA